MFGGEEGKVLLSKLLRDKNVGSLEDVAHIILVSARCAVDSLQNLALVAMKLLPAISTLQWATTAFQIGRQFPERGAEKAHRVLIKD